MSIDTSWLYVWGTAASILIVGFFTIVGVYLKKDETEVPARERLQDPFDNE